MNDVKKLTTERGKTYGHPLDHFNCTETMYDAWLVKRAKGIIIPPVLEKCLRHIVYFVLDKLARLAQDPYHIDNMDDVQGYASLWKECLDESKKRDLEGRSEGMAGAVEDKDISGRDFYAGGGPIIKGICSGDC